MRKMAVRMAENHEGERVKALVDPDNDFFPGIDWQDIYPYWVAVTYEDSPDQMIACAQVIASKPVGHIEFLSLEESLNDVQRAYAIKMIENNAQLLLYGNGVYVARSCIPFDMKQWKKIVKKRWGVHMFEANVFAMRMQ